MDEDEAKTIASDWVRRLEASLLAKVSAKHDNTILGDQFYPRHHQDGSVSNSFSHDDLERKHLGLEKTSSDEKIHHEAIGLPSEEEPFCQNVGISKIKTAGTKTPNSDSNNGFSSPRIDLEDLRKKRLVRFENLNGSPAKSSEENPECLSSEEEFLKQDKMLQYETSPLGNEENSLRERQWNSKPCSYGAPREINDEDDKLRLELWGLRGAVESGQLDINSYLGPMYSGSKTVGHSSKSEVKKESNSGDFRTFHNSSVSQECSSSRDANFNLEQMHKYQATQPASYITEEDENISPNKIQSWKASHPRSGINGIVDSCHGNNITKEDFTRFSVSKSSESSYGKGAAPWPQIEGKLYNGFETSDSESSLNMLSVHHGNTQKNTQDKSDFAKPNKIKPLRSGKGKQKILDELTTFLDSERKSKRAAKESARRTQKVSKESRRVESPVHSGDFLSDSLLLSNEPAGKKSDLLINSESKVSKFITEGYSKSSDSHNRELSSPLKTSQSKYGDLKLLSSVLAAEDGSTGCKEEERSVSSGTQIAKVCKTCKEVNSKAANWCIECGTALIKVEPVILTLEQQSKYEMQCQATKAIIAEALNSNKQFQNGSTTMSKTEKDLYKDVLHLSKEVEKNSGFSNESLQSNLSNYKHRWQKSSIAWSSFEPQELSKPPSVVKRNGTKKEIEKNLKKSGSDFRSRSSSDLLVTEGSNKKHGSKNGHSKVGGRCRTTSANYHSADDYDSRNRTSINLELSNQERTRKDELSNKARPVSATCKSTTKNQQTKHQKKRASSAKPRTASQSSSSSPELLSPGKGEKQDGRERKSDVMRVQVPNLNLDDVGNYDRILTLIRSQRDCEPVPYLYLPEEIILQIFSYLPMKDRVSCAQICWQFYRIAMDESLWKAIVIRKNKNINDTWLESIGDRHPASLTISQCSGSDVTSNGLRSLFRKCSRTLEEVDFSGCSGGELIGESILLHIAARCSGVLSVDVSWTNVSDNGMEALTENLTRLECLCLNGCQAITDKTLTCVANKHGESLRIFEVFGCFNITPASLQVFANKCVHLQTLNIGQCHKMTDSAIGNLVSHLPELENLDLRGCKQARDSAVKKVVRHCPHLTSLVLANCPLITDVALSEISTNLPAIKSLDICGCANITDAGVCALARCCHKLELLDLSSTGNSVTSKSVVSLANYCSQSLQVLKLSFCADVTVHTVNQLAKNCKKLRLLHLYGCKRIREHDKLKRINPLLVIEK